MIEKIRTKNNINNQDRQNPKTIQELINRYDLDNTEVINKLNELIDYLKERGI